MNYFKENITFLGMYISQCLKNFLHNLKCNTKCVMSSEVSEPLVGRQGSRVSMRVARGSASLLPSHGREIMLLSWQ